MPPLLQHERARSRSAGVQRPLRSRNNTPDSRTTPVHLYTYTGRTPDRNLASLPSGTCYARGPPASCYSTNRPPRPRCLSVRVNKRRRQAPDKPDFPSYAASSTINGRTSTVFVAVRPELPPSACCCRCSSSPTPSLRPPTQPSRTIRMNSSVPLRPRLAVGRLVFRQLRDAGKMSTYFDDSLTLSFMDSFSLSHSLTHSLTLSFIHSLTHPWIHSLIHSLIDSLTH